MTFASTRWIRRVEQPVCDAFVGVLTLKGGVQFRGSAFRRVCERRTIGSYVGSPNR